MSWKVLQRAFLFRPELQEFSVTIPSAEGRMEWAQVAGRLTASKARWLTIQCNSLSLLLRVAQYNDTNVVGLRCSASAAAPRHYSLTLQ
jgi:hypothetical protein